MSERIPRLSLSELPPELAERLRPRVERLGYLGEFFQCAAHQPGALVAFLRLTDELRGAVAEGVAEVVALTVSAWMGNAYERVQHERLCLARGFREAWIRDVVALAPAASRELAPAERAVETLALAVLARQGRDSTKELDEVVDHLGPAGAVAVLLLIGRYVAHGLMVNCLALRPPVPSPLAA